MADRVVVTGAPTLRRNIALLSMLQSLNYVTPLVTIPHLVRALGPSHYGLLAFAQALTLYFDVFTDFGFSLSATREVALNRDQPELLRTTFFSTITVRIALMLVSALIYSVIVLSTPRLRTTPLLFASTFLVVVGTALFPVWFFQGLQQLKLPTAAMATSRILTVPSIYLFVHRPEDVVMTGAIQGGVPVLTALMVAPWVWRRLGRRVYRPGLADLVRALCSGWHAFVSNSTLLLSTSSTAVILGFVAGNVQVGYFSAAEKPVKALTALLSPVMQALYPYLTALKEESTELALTCLRRSFRLILLLGLAASVGTLVFAGPVSRLVFGPSFQPSILVIKCLAPLPLLVGIVNVLGLQTMMVFRMDALVTRVLIFCALATLPLLVLLSHWLGAAGAAVASATGMALIAGSMAVILHGKGLAVWRAARHIVPSHTPVLGVHGVAGSAKRRPAGESASVST